MPIAECSYKDEMNQVNFVSPSSKGLDVLSKMSFLVTNQQKSEMNRNLSFVNV